MLLEERLWVSCVNVPFFVGNTLRIQSNALDVALAHAVSPPTTAVIDNCILCGRQFGDCYSLN